MKCIIHKTRKNTYKMPWSTLHIYIYIVIYSFPLYTAIIITLIYYAKKNVYYFSHITVCTVL